MLLGWQHVGLGCRVYLGFGLLCFRGLGLHVALQWTTSLGDLNPACKVRN